MGKSIICVVAIAIVALACGRASADSNDSKGKVIEITQTQYKQLICDYTKSLREFVGSRPAIVDFSASWCGPCKRLAPILDELAAEYDGQIDFYKVDVDACPQLSQAYGISSVPTVLFCPMTGDPLAIVGLYPKEEIVNVINYLFFK